MNYMKSWTKLCGVVSKWSENKIIPFSTLFIQFSLVFIIARTHTHKPFSMKISKAHESPISNLKVWKCVFTSSFPTDIMKHAFEKVFLFSLYDVFFFYFFFRGNWNCLNWKFSFSLSRIANTKSILLEGITTFQAVCLIMINFFSSHIEMHGTRFRW